MSSDKIDIWDDFPTELSRYIDDAFLIKQFRRCARQDNATNERLAQELERQGYTLPTVIHVDDISEYPDWHWDRVYLVKTPDNWREVLVPFASQDRLNKKRTSLGIYMCLARFVEIRKPVFRGLTKSRDPIPTEVYENLYRHFTNAYYWGGFRDRKPISLNFSNSWLDDDFRLAALQTTKSGKAAIFTRSFSEKRYADLGHEHVFVPLTAKRSPTSTISYTVKADQAVLADINDKGDVLKQDTFPLTETLTAHIRNIFDHADRPTFIASARINWPEATTTNQP